MNQKSLFFALALVVFSGNASAQLSWCCANEQHPGATAAERCEANKEVFAKQQECDEKKESHDQSTGHNSKCAG